MALPVKRAKMALDVGSAGCAGGVVADRVDHADAERCQDTDADAERCQDTDAVLAALPEDGASSSN